MDLTFNTYPCGYPRYTHDDENEAELQRCFLFINIDVILRHAHFSGWQKAGFVLFSWLPKCDSDQVKSLDPVARSRYHFKLSYDKGASSLPDPYNLKGWTNNPISWPDLTFGDPYMYLIETPDIYRTESLKAFKSLEAYQFVVSGHLKPL